MICPFCKEEIQDGAIKCKHCGSNLINPKKISPLSISQKDWLTTLLLCIFLGGIGIHRFYTGHIKTGIIQLLTLGGLGIWALIDLINIAREKFYDGEGRLIQRH